MEKTLDFLLRPRTDMWWLRKERLLVVDRRNSRETGRRRERRLVRAETETQSRTPGPGDRHHTEKLDDSEAEGGSRSNRTR